MPRLDWKIGRFSDQYETNEIMAGLRGWQSVNGDTYLYYRFDKTDSGENDIYDEGGSQGKFYKGPFELAALHVTHVEGANENTEEGFYYNDNIHITASFNALTRAGLTQMDLDTGNFLKDRIVYDDKVFRVTNISVTGQIQGRDIITGIDATQVKPDELVDDAQFAKWARHTG